MELYSRRQLALLLVVLAVGGLGLGVGRWRRSHPDLVTRLEQLETIARDESPDALDGEATQASGEADRARAGAKAPRRGSGGGAREETRATSRERSRAHLKLEAAEDGNGPLDLNRATVLELTRLPGVGPVLAERILAARVAAGFASIDDLRRVRGLGRVRLERLRALVTVADAGVEAEHDPLVQ